MTKRSFSFLTGLLAGVLMLGSVFSSSAQAAMISSQNAISEQARIYDQAALMSAMDAEGVRDQLTSLGVDPTVVEDRIQSLTADELAQLNQQIQDLPAGQGVLGVLLTVFVVFVITDLLCATNIFPFINCIR